MALWHHYRVHVTAYLRRIGLSAPVPIDRNGLERLQRAHLTAVPFENLDVFYGRGVETGSDWSVPKVVERRRGGWCYELNGAFAALLEGIGFNVKRLGAFVLLDGEAAEHPDHLTLEISLERPYLVDVGFGDSFIKPLPLDEGGPHDGGTGYFSFQFAEDMTTLTTVTGSEFQPQYRFGPAPHDLGDFDRSSDLLQHDPEKSWTKGRLVTRLLDGGPDRVTLLEGRLKFRRNGTWTETPVAEEDWAAALDEWFGMAP